MHPGYLEIEITPAGFQNLEGFSHPNALEIRWPHIWQPRPAMSVADQTAGVQPEIWWMANFNSQGIVIYIYIINYIYNNIYNMSHIWMFVSASIFASTFMISQTAELADGLRDVLLRFHMG